MRAEFIIYDNMLKSWFWSIRVKVTSFFESVTSITIPFFLNVILWLVPPFQRFTLHTLRSYIRYYF
jgi:hypothetical protein